MNGGVTLSLSSNVCLLCAIRCVLVQAFNSIVSTFQHPAHVTLLFVKGVWAVRKEAAISGRRCWGKRLRTGKEERGDGSRQKEMLCHSNRMRSKYGDENWAIQSSFRTTHPTRPGERDIINQTLLFGPAATAANGNDFWIKWWLFATLFSVNGFN